MEIEIISYYLLILGVIMAIISALFMTFEAMNKGKKLDCVFFGLMALYLILNTVWVVIKDFYFMYDGFFVPKILIFVLSSILMYFIVIHKSSAIKIENQKKNRKEGEYNG